MKLAVLLPACFALAFVVSTTGSAETHKESTSSVPAPSCAIRFSSMSLHNDRIGFSFANNSEQTIQGIEFGAAVYDSVQQPHRILVDGGIRRRIHSKQLVSYDLNIKKWKGTGYAGWMLWPSKVLYTDGSTWEMGSDHSACGVEHWLDKPLRPSASPVEVLAQVPELGGE